jgi:hypothetical protein
VFRAGLVALAGASVLVAPFATEGGNRNGGYVQGHVRKDGSYVAPHYRAPSGAPRSYAPSLTGQAARDPATRAAFHRQNPCPSTGKASGACPGYVVDHVHPLKRAGADRPSNMRWQTVEEAKRKGRVE